MNIYDDKPKKIKPRGAPLKPLAERKISAHVSFSPDVFNALEQMSGGRSELIEAALRKHYLIG